MLCEYTLYEIIKEGYLSSFFLKSLSLVPAQYWGFLLFRLSCSTVVRAFNTVVYLLGSY